MAIIHKFVGDVNEFQYQWDGVEAEPSPNPEIAEFEKNVLIGPKDGAQNFVIRYFNLPVGGASPLHTHSHEHGIVIVNGECRIQLADDFHNLSGLDAVFIPGNELHQIVNVGSVPLGFFCTIIRSAEYA